MKKITLSLASLLIAFCFNLQAAAQSDTLSYSFLEGTFSEESTTTEGYYQKWDSEDGLLSVTTTGYFYASKLASTYFMYSFPGTITMKAADGYVISNIKVTVYSNNGGNTVVWTYDDGTSDSFAPWAYCYPKKAFNTQTVNIVQSGAADKELCIYDNGTYKYTFVNIIPATSGIGAAVTTKSTKPAVYDLQGRRVQNPQKGIYIVNHHKVAL
jgi:hypothetical protein